MKPDKRINLRSKTTTRVERRKREKKVLGMGWHESGGENDA